jgi:homoserine O-acetyltransferase
MPVQGKRLIRALLRTGLPVVFLLYTSSVLSGSEIAVAQLDECALENGQRIVDCKVAYRTFGKLNSDKTNVVLMPTWYNGSTADLATYGYVGAGKIVDSNIYYVVAVEAFGNGISSSPSNHILPAGAEFPTFSTRDMVHAQHRLLTQTLGFEQIHAVVGVSMGGNQVYEWMMQYPHFARSFVPIEGTPWPTTYDLLLWNGWRLALDSPLTSTAEIERAGALLTTLDALTLWTPDYVNREHSGEAFDSYFAGQQGNVTSATLQDRASQTRAILNHDIRTPHPHFDSYIEKLGKLNVLAVVFRSDMMVNPSPNWELGKKMGFEVLQIDSDCGHMSPNPECDQITVAESVQNFLAENEAQVTSESL